MSNIGKMFFRINDYDVVVADPNRKPQRGEIAVMMFNGKVIISRVIKNMQGVNVIGRLAQIRRDYQHGTPPLTVFDTRGEREFYYSLQPFEQLLYRGLFKAEHLRSFADYHKAETYFYKRVNRTRRRMEKEGK